MSKYYDKFLLKLQGMQVLLAKPGGCACVCWEGGMGGVQGLCVLGGRDERGAGIVCAGREGWKGCRDCVDWEGCRDCVCWEGGMGGVQGLCVLGGRDGRGAGIVCAGREGWEGCKDCVDWEEISMFVLSFDQCLP